MNAPEGEKDMVTIENLNVGMLVNYVGSVEDLLDDLPDREELESYFLGTNEFRVAEIKNWDTHNIGIEYKISELEGHLFYVNASDLQIITGS